MINTWQFISNLILLMYGQKNTKLLIINDTIVMI